jgi:serine O-acetyltransferase
MNSIEDFLSIIPNTIPNAFDIYKKSHQMYIENNLKDAKKYQKLNYLLHNSVIYYDCKIGDEVNFAYGGIGTVIHKDAIIDDFCVLGTNITIGGKAGGKERNIDNSCVPRLDKYVVVSTGSKIIGGITIGCFSIIGANSVITKNIEPFSIVVGNNKIIGKIDEQKFLDMKNNWTCFKNKSEDDILKIFRLFYKS